MELTNEQKNKIEFLIKSHISQKGSCRVGWAVKIIAGENFEKSIHNLEKIANLLIQSGAYIKEPSAQSPKDWNILKNPEFKIWRLNKISIIINLIFTLITVSIAIWTIFFKS